MSQTPKLALSITVYGIPGPQGSKRFVGRDQRGRGVMLESSAKVRPWRFAVAWEARQARHGRAPLDGPLSISMVFTLPKPTAAPKTRRTWAMRKPDLSKLARSTEDALTDGGAIADDARIVEYTRLAKVFPNEDADSLDVPGVRIHISQLVEEAA